MSLQGKVVLITGAGGGIGRVTAQAFAAAGAQLFLTDNRAAPLEETLAALPAGATAAFAVADVGDPASVQGLFAALIKRYGRLDSAFNNAGVGGGAKPLAEVDDAVWDQCLRVCLTGTFLCMREELRILQAQGQGGTIVNNCSVLGIKGGLGDASAPYTAAKHGIAGLTKNAAITYGPQGIRINAVCPGLIEAGLGLKVMERPAEKVEKLIAMHPQGRAGTAQEVASAVLWLASEQSSFVNGHLLAVDGGYSSR